MNSYKAEITRITQDLSIRDKIVQDMLTDKDRSLYYESGNIPLLSGSPSKNKDVDIIKLVKLSCSIETRL
jgi:hypothetical protein